MTAQKPRVPNVPSSLLSNYENGNLFRIIGGQCRTLATAVVQVFLAESPSFQRWVKKCCGVACFIKDHSKRSHYIRVYNLRSNSVIWEQELYNGFKYVTARDFFHTFDTDDCPAALNFSNVEEADKFKTAVQEKIFLRDQRKEKRKRTSTGAVINPTRPNAPLQSGNSNSTLSSSGDGSLKLNKERKVKKDKKSSKIRKEDIGIPSDFRHVNTFGGFGSSTNNGMLSGLKIETNINFEEYPELKPMFDMIGLSQDELKDESTRKLIYEVFQDRGGIEAVKKEIKQNNRPLPPKPAPQVPPSVSSSYNMSNSNSSHASSNKSQAPPPPPSRAAPPPLPPSRLAPTTRGMQAPPPPPPSRNFTSNSNNLSSPPHMAPPPPPLFRAPHVPSPSGPAPPPPPPFPPVFNQAAPPPPPPMLPSKPAFALPAPAQDGRGALLDQIRGGGATLKKRVDNNSGLSQTDSRDDLLAAIRKAPKLKTVDSATLERERRPEPSPGAMDIGAALQLALSKRAKTIQDDISSDEEDEDDEDDDDWEDD